MITNIAPCILIEGLDLAGKTSVCQALVAGMSPRPDHRRNALTNSNIIYDVADQMRREGGLPGTYLGHLYLAAMAMDLRLYTPPARVTIQESTIGLRSFAHYQARGEDGLAYGFAALLDTDEYPRFACSIVLTASMAARRHRLEMRRREAPEEIAADDLAVIVSPDIFRRMDNILIAEATKRYGAVVIDTSEISVAEIVAAAQKVISGAVDVTGIEL